MQGKVEVTLSQKPFLLVAKKGSKEGISNWMTALPCLLACLMLQEKRYKRD